MLKHVETMIYLIAAGRGVDSIVYFAFTSTNQKNATPVPVLPRDMHNSRWTCAKSSRRWMKQMGLSENGVPPIRMFPIWMDINWGYIMLYVPFLNQPQEIPIFAHTC